MLSFLRKFWNFSEKQLLIRFLFFAVLIKFLLKITSYQQTVNIFRLISKRMIAQPLSFTELHDLTYRIYTTFAIFSNCLVWTLVVFTVFKKTFPNLEIKIGVNEESGFQAHAWLENEGQIIDFSQSSFQEIHREQ
jgi:hypothetical protein